MLRCARRGVRPGPRRGEAPQRRRWCASGRQERAGGESGLVDTIDCRSMTASSTRPGLSESTRRAYASDLADFGGWLERTGRKLEDVDVQALAEYTTELGRGRRGLAPATIARRLAAVRSFIGFTLGAARVPAIALPPKRRRRLPDAPKLAEVEAILATVEGDGALAVRNAAILELDVLLRPAHRRGGRAPARRRGLRAGVGARARQGRQGAHRPARRTGRACRRDLSPRRAALARARRERQRCSSPSAGGRSTPRSCVA